MLSKKDLIIFLLIGVIIFTNFRQNKKIEKMSNIDTIKTVVNKLYKADVQSIRNLAEISQKLQKGTLTIPGNLTVKGNIKCGPNLIKNNGEIHGIDIHATSSLNSKNANIKNILNVSKNAYIGDYMKTNRLDIKGKHGMTHFNYANKGDTYLRDNVYVHDFMRTNRLDIKGKHGTNHFNYANRGTNYLRGTNYIDHMSYFKSGAQFHGWSGWATRNRVSIPSGYSSAATLINGPNENGNIYLGSNYGNTKRSHMLRKA